MREYLIEMGAEPLSFVSSEKNSDDFLKVAQLIRDKLGLGESWFERRINWSTAFRELIEKVEEIGINVVMNGVVGNNTPRKLDPEEFRGFVLIDEYSPFIFINRNDYISARIFTLVHELAHIWLGSSAAFDLRELQPADNITEILCNRIATELLVPGDLLKEK